MSIRSATLEYLNMSQNNIPRHLVNTLKFFQSYPNIIEVEKSKMANPVIVINYLAEHLNYDKEKELRDRFIIGFLFWTGIRVGELVLTRKKDVNLIAKTYSVPTLKQKRNSNKQVIHRNIPLDHVPLRELELWNEYLARIQRNDFIVKITKRQVERIVKKTLGEEFTPHTLRHSLGLWLYELTKDIRLVSQILRHTNIANTLIYTRLSLEEIREKLRSLYN